SGSTDRTFQGILDEIRLETGTRSADWVKAQYLSMTDAFVTFAAAQGPGGVLANDTDADGDPLTAIQVSANPANAQSFVLNPDGSFSYTPVANFSGVDTFTYKVNDGTVDGNTVVVTINVTPVNDAPLVATNTGTTVNEASSGNIISTAMLNEGDPDDAGTGLTYTITAATPNGTLRLSGSALGLNDTFTQDDIDTNRLTYDHNGSETITDSFNFSLADGGENGATPATGTFTITVTPANDPPVFSGLDNTPTYTEGGTAVVLDNNATIADIELDTANNYNGATLTLVRNGGANGEDLFANTGTLNALTESGSLVVGGTTIGTVTTNSGGTLVLTFNGNATTARVNSALQQLTYANSSGTPPASVQIDFTFNDGNAGAQGSGGALNGTGSITVTITPTNTAPTVDLDANNSSGATGNDYMVTFTEGDGPTAIADSDTDLVDADSIAFDHVTLSVSGLLDGNAETLVLDGDTFALATAVAGQDTTGGNYRVVIATGAGTATLTITKQGGGTSARWKPKP
ncbi:MAG: cadherin-like domain-containing protein, partial [Nitrospira sp.]|nr:cadherin-like domain-containing protein [Nitrospira sp.]